MNALVPVRAFTDPILSFAGPPIAIARPERATLADLIALVPLDHEAWRPHLRAKLGGVIIDPALYHRILPKHDAFVDIVLPVHGGKNGILGTLAVIALVGASVFVGAAGLPFLGSAFAAGSVGANLVAGGLSLAASLLLQGLNTPQATDSAGNRQIGSASAQNSFEPGAHLPRVLGTRRLPPPLVMPPYSRIDGDDQIVTAVYGLSGAHQLADIRVGAADIAGAADITYELREGFASDADLTLVTDTRIEVPMNLRLSQFRMQSADEDSNKIDTSISPYVPQWHRVETKIGPDRSKLYFTFEGGLGYGADSGPVPAITALRVRLRKRGTATWYNLPEFLLRGAKQNGALRVFLDFNWLPTGSMPGSVTAFSTTYGGFSWKYHLVTDNAAAVTYWTADPYFATNKIDWLNKQQVKIYLDTATFAQDDAYEIELMRGYTTDRDGFTIISGTVHRVVKNGLTSYDFFSTQLDGGFTKVPNAQTRAVDALVVSVIQSIWNEYPFDFTYQPTALIAIEARNRSLEQVTVAASGYMADWNGTSWVADQVTSNPASHYRHVARDDLNAEPVPSTLMPDEEMQDWHEWCTSEGLKNNAIIKGMAVDQVLSIIAQAGFARPRYGATYGVVIDRPRDPVALITQRTASGFSFSKPFGRLPHALKAEFADETRDDEVREITVYADGYAAVATPVPFAFAFINDTATVNGVYSGDIDGAGYFARASIATRVNAAGLIETVASGAWRLDHDRSTLDPLGALFEGAATNLLLRSAELDNAVWAQLNATIGVNATTAPDGTTTADKIIENTATAAHRIIAQGSNAVSLTSGATYTFSFFAKAAGRTHCFIRVNNSGGDPVAGTIRLADGVVTQTQFGSISTEMWPNGWVRCIGTGTSAVTAASYAEVRAGNSDTYANYTGDGSSGIYVWGLDLKAGAVATSYIPTAGSQVTRLADAMAVPLADFDYNGGAGTLTLNGTPVTPVIAGSDLDVAATALAAGVSHIETLTWDSDAPSYAEATRFDSISYESITNEAQVRRRARQDMRFAKWRSRLINFNTDIEHLAYTLGDRALLETDILGQESGRGRVRSITTGAGLVTGLVLDERRDFTKADADAVQRAVAIRLQDGTIVVKKVTGDDTNLNAVVFTTPFAMPTDGGDDLIVEGTLVATGSYGQEARDVLIWDLAPGPQLTAQITAIDYAADAMYGAPGFTTGFSIGFRSAP